MKALRIILIVLIVLVGGYSIWMATIDPEYKVERTEVIEAEPERVYATVSDFTTWQDWSKWHSMDPNMEITYGDKSAGEGATYTWKGNDDVGAGTQTITAAVPNKSLETHIAFEGMGESDGYWNFEPVEEGKTKVTWGFTGEMPYFFRVFNLGMDKSVGADFEEGLSNLKEKIESMPVQEKPEVKIEVVDMEAMPYYGIRHDISWEEMNSEFFEKNYNEIMAHLGEDAQNMMMPPMVLYFEWDEENRTTVLEPAIAVKSEKPATDNIKKGMTHGGKALKSVHMGAYSETGKVHEAMNARMEKKGYGWPEGGAAMEVYVTDPGEEPDTAKWVTEIYYPILMEKQKKEGKDMDKKEKTM